LVCCSVCAKSGAWSRQGLCESLVTGVDDEEWSDYQPLVSTEIPLSRKHENLSRTPGNDPCHSCMDWEALDRVKGAGAGNCFVQSHGEGVCGMTSASDSGDMLPPGQCALMITGTAQARPPPNLLLVASPNLLKECAGCYILQANAHANGQPFWKHGTRDYWLFSTPTGRWAIAGKDVRDEGFVRASGWIYQELHHEGLMPDQSTSCWQLFDGGGFTSDEAFQVIA